MLCTQTSNRRQAISDELQALDDLENLFGWTYSIAQDRTLLRLQLAALDQDEALVSRAMQGATL